MKGSRLKLRNLHASHALCRILPAKNFTYSDAGPNRLRVNFGANEGKETGADKAEKKRPGMKTDKETTSQMLVDFEKLLKKWEEQVSDPKSQRGTGQAALANVKRNSLAI